MSPLLSSRGTTFQAHQEVLGISKETAVILDNMRFLLLATVKGVDRPMTSQDRSKLRKTALWTRDWLANLPTGHEPDSHLLHDFVYQSCRVAAHIYCRAIAEHTSLSKAYGIQDLAQLWGSVWRVSLSRWKQLPGIFLWVLLSAIQAAETTPYGRFLKSMVKGVMTYLAVDHWDIVDAAGMGFVRLQRWLRSKDYGGDGEEVITEAGKLEVGEFLHIYQVTR
jgi:hypothetical protein